jgi:cytochrome c peroxidase
MIRGLASVAVASSMLALAFVETSCGASHDSTPAVVGGDGGIDGSSCAPSKYPAPPFGVTAGSTLANDSFFGVAADGSAKTLSFADSYEPCASRARVLVIRIGGGFCGTCQWHVSHTGALLATDLASRVRILDLLVRNDDNDPPLDPAYAATWYARQDAHAEVALDPNFTTEPLVTGRIALPYFVLVDTTSMTIKGTLSNPSPDALERTLRLTVAALDGAPAPPLSAPPSLVDGRFTKDQWDMIASMALPTAPPPDPTNAKADDPAAAALGQKLFADASLSPSGRIACVSCHHASKGFADGLSTPTVGALPGDRNTPSLLFASDARWQMWDGRADSMWMQALLPIEDAHEMSSSRLFVAHAIFDRYKAAYEAVFEPLPALSDTTRFPASGTPKDAVWAAMAPGDQDAVNRAFVGVGKAIAAFERRVRATSDTPLDAYAKGDASALSDAQKDGLAAFFRAGCATCHYGPRLTDDAFHILRTPTGRADHTADEGRLVGIGLFTESEFRASGKYSDAPLVGATHVVPTAWEWSEGSFKTPPLRGVVDTAPYGHGGTLATLDEVVEIHRTGGLPKADKRAIGTTERWLAEFDEKTRDAILVFLRVLSQPARSPLP